MFQAEPKREMWVKKRKDKPKMNVVEYGTEEPVKWK